MLLFSGYHGSWSFLEGIAMSDRIKVHVVRYRECKNLILRYRDPLTGKHVRKSSGTASIKDARKAATRWEDELNSGRDRRRYAVTWEQFRLRYESEVLLSLAPRTAKKADSVFNVLERIVPQVKNGLLRELTAERLSVLQAELRKAGRAESSITGTLAYVHAALAWALDQGLIAELPKMKRPKRAKRSGGADPMKGRPITTEEFERMLGKVSAGLAPEPVKPKADGQRKRKPYNRKPPATIAHEVVESWRHLLRGLWWSGLRLGEALNVYWDRADKLCVDLSGRRPMLRIVAELEKGGRDRLLPLAPEFAEFLLQTPESERHGRVFKPLGKDNNVVGLTFVGHIISRIGKAAGAKVHTDYRTGKIKYASAHDLRRSFGERWSTRVMPQVLMAMMRHESIGTTMRFYVGRNANTTADAAWAAYENGKRGTVLGTVAKNEQAAQLPILDLNGCRDESYDKSQGHS
jgi:integrase